MATTTISTTAPVRSSTVQTIVEHSYKADKCNAVFFTDTYTLNRGREIINVNRDSLEVGIFLFDSLVHCVFSVGFVFIFHFVGSFVVYNYSVRMYMCSGIMLGVFGFSHFLFRYHTIPFHPHPLVNVPQKKKKQ